MPMIGAMNQKRPFAAWVLAALLAVPASAAAEIVNFRAVADLPRAIPGDSLPNAWRNVRIVAESDLLDAEMEIAGCLPATSASRMAFDSGCATPAGVSADGNPGQRFALTFKVPRLGNGAPLVEMALRNWRTSSRAGLAGELVVTQPLGAVDAFIGYSTPFTRMDASGGWRSAFAGATWYVAQATRLEFVADRGESVSTARIDRTMTLRVVHATPSRDARFTAWTTRALDDPRDAWQVGIGVEVAF